MARHRKAWTRSVATLLVVALVAATASTVSARPNVPPVEPIRYGPVNELLPEGAGVTPMTTAELQAVDGEMVQFLMIGARVAARAAVACARSIHCRIKASHTTQRIVRGAAWFIRRAGAGYTIKSLAEDGKRLFDRLTGRNRR